jgi:hypothetical protein
MTCDTQTLPGQTFTERKQEVRDAVADLSRLLASGQAKAIVSRATGSVAFRGWEGGETGRITDACAYRLVMATGSALAKQAIQKAELLAGRTVDRAALTAGHHSHDGGKTWHHGH